MSRSTKADNATRADSGMVPDQERLRARKVKDRDGAQMTRRDNSMQHEDLWADARKRTETIRTTMQAVT